MTNDHNRRILVTDGHRAIHKDFRKILRRPAEGNALARLSQLQGALNFLWR
jgi:hypothetical protein